MAISNTRREFLRSAASIGGVQVLLSEVTPAAQRSTEGGQRSQPGVSRKADYTLVIAVKPIEIAPQRILRLTTYNGQFPGPLLRVKEASR